MAYDYKPFLQDEVRCVFDRATRKLQIELTELENAKQTTIAPVECYTEDNDMRRMHNGTWTPDHKEASLLSAVNSAFKKSGFQSHDMIDLSKGTRDFCGDLTYGELRSPIQLFTALGLNAKDVFFDLVRFSIIMSWLIVAFQGSGRGQIICAAAISYPTLRAVGVELIDVRHLAAVRAMQTVDAETFKYVELRHEVQLLWVHAVIDWAP